MRIVSHPLGPLLLKAIVIAKFTTTQCLIYYLHLRQNSHPLQLKAIIIASFTTVQCLIYYLHVRHVSHPLGPLHHQAIFKA